MVKIAYQRHQAQFIAAAEHIVAGEPRLPVLHQVFILSGCRDSRGHLNSTVRFCRFLNFGVGVS